MRKMGSSVGYKTIGTVLSQEGDTEMPVGSPLSRGDKWQRGSGTYQSPGVFRIMKTQGFGGGLAQGLGIRLFAFGGAYWPLATAHSDPLWVRTCFGCVNGAPG